MHPCLTPEEIKKLDQKVVDHDAGRWRSPVSL